MFTGEIANLRIVRVDDGVAELDDHCQVDSVLEEADPLSPPGNGELAPLLGSGKRNSYFAELVFM